MGQSNPLWACLLSPAPISETISKVPQRIESSATMHCCSGRSCGHGTHEAAAMMQQCSHDLHCAIRRVGCDLSVKRHISWAISAGRFENSRSRDRGSSHPSADHRYALVPAVSTAGLCRSVIVVRCVCRASQPAEQDVFRAPDRPAIISDEWDLDDTGMQQQQQQSKRSAWRPERPPPESGPQQRGWQRASRTGSDANPRQRGWNGGGRAAGPSGAPRCVLPH